MLEISILSDLLGGDRGMAREIFERTSERTEYTCSEDKQKTGKQSKYYHRISSIASNRNKNMN